MATIRMIVADRHVAQMIRHRRIEIGMSQEELARGLGITFQQVQKYEKGLNRISVGRLFGISVMLGVPVSHFYVGMPETAIDEIPKELHHPHWSFSLSTEESEWSGYSREEIRLIDDLRELQAQHPAARPLARIQLLVQAMVKMVTE